MECPALVFVVSLVTLWLSSHIGAYLCRRRGALNHDERADLGVIITASLTLLGLIIGFTFSMAITRYDQRKATEAAEANAIGTEITRAGLLPATASTRVRGLLKEYLNQRSLFYTTRTPGKLKQIETATGRLQEDLWSTVQESTAAQSTAVAMLLLSGMNDVLNSQAYTQAAWWNRIPVAAWVLMATIAIYCDYLIGYTARGAAKGRRKFLPLPLIISISFFLIADIDSPRGGVIRVHPQNIESVLRAVR